MLADQFKTVLKEAGVLPKIEKSILQLDMQSQLKWHYEKEFKLSCPLVLWVKNQLGWKDKEFERLFGGQTPC